MPGQFFFLRISVPRESSVWLRHVATDAQRRARGRRFRRVGACRRPTSPPPPIPANLTTRRPPQTLPFLVSSPPPPPPCHALVVVGMLFHCLDRSVARLLSSLRPCDHASSALGGGLEQWGPRPKKLFRPPHTGRAAGGTVACRGAATRHPPQARWISRHLRSPPHRASPRRRGPPCLAVATAGTPPWPRGSP